MDVSCIWSQGASLPVSESPYDLRGSCRCLLTKSELKSVCLTKSTAIMV